MVPKIIMSVVFYIFLSIQLHTSMAQTNWIRAGFYMYNQYEFPISEINFALFTHIICEYAAVNSTSYQLSLSPADEQHFPEFTHTIKQNNPSVATMLSIHINGDATYSTMVSTSSNRKSFIDSSIKIARRYGFEGLDFSWQFPATSIDMFNMGILFKEWKAAIDLEATDSSRSALILTAKVYNTPKIYSTSYPIESIQQHLDWVHFFVDYIKNDISWDRHTSTEASLYNPYDFDNADCGIREWIDGGLSANKMVLTLPFYGFAWRLENPMDNGIGAPAKVQLNLCGELLDKGNNLVLLQ
ncbi:class V chitinase-like [Pistacia vera]|uniref:class V chitinase-like n=1 Tax=Pistacia vera TaxID=55513 RepID=UPI001263E13B|nr:class V chitinase-like [Pistacia vera]